MRNAALRRAHRWQFEALLPHEFAAEIRAAS